MNQSPVASLDEPVASGQSLSSTGHGWLVHRLATGNWFIDWPLVTDSSTGHWW